MSKVAFNETWDIFNGVQEVIEEIESDDAVRHNEERRSFEEGYFAISSELEALLKSN